ncbi:hypothetical protein BYT27DRAFT_7214099 [Phlegmacium glaucopus]|nr:hypothetical protein BYT27DRAFT_7214099 [Phlegmacium glaucopus]
MMYKAALTFSLLFLAVATSSAQSDNGTYTSGQPPSASSSEAPTVASQPCPSDPAISTLPTASHNISDGIHGHETARPTGCQPYSGIPTMNSSFPQVPSGVPSSMADGASLLPMPTFTDCPPYSESTIPTMTADGQSLPGGALPTGSASGPIPYNTTINGTLAGNHTFPIPTSQPVSSGPVEQAPPMSTATTTSYVVRRRLVRRQV